MMGWAECINKLSQKIYEEVAEAILHMIQTGQLKPGDKLDSVQFFKR